MDECRKEFNDVTERMGARGRLVISFLPRVKGPLGVPETPVTPTDFNAPENQKSIRRLSDSTWQLTFTKLPLVKLWCSTKEEKLQ